MVVEINVAATLDAVQPFAQLGEPVCALGIDPGQEDRFDVGYVFACLPSDRQRAGDSASDAWPEYWSPNTFRDDDAVLVPPPAGDPRFARAEELLRRSLDGGVLAPAEWLMARVARALSVAAMPFETTDDFIALAFDTSFSALLFDQLKFSAPPERFALLRERGIVGVRADLD